MDHVSISHFAKERKGQRIKTLAPNMPGLADNSDRELPDGVAAILLSKADQSCRRLTSHVPRQLEGVALGAPGDDSIAVEQRRHNVKYVWWFGHECIPAFIILSSTPMRLFSLVTIDPVAFVFSAAFFVAIGWFVRLRS